MLLQDLDGLLLFADLFAQPPEFLALGAGRLAGPALARRYQPRRDSELILHAFLRGLDRDHDAVNAALALPHGAGPAEGVSTKIKRIARQMHGRAGFTLLRHRILLGQHPLRHHRM